MEDARLLLAHIDETIGRDSTNWPPPPVGYPGEVEAALLDSVFSLRAVYGKSSDTGPRRVVARWRDHADRPLNSLKALKQDVCDLGETDEFKHVLGNDGVAVPSAADKPSKALAVYTSASALVDMGIDTAEDVVTELNRRPKQLLRAIQAGRGVGPQATTYFLMNLGIPGVKADVMINRFVQTAVDRHVSEVEAANLITALAADLSVDVIHLDHAIWRHGSAAARKRVRKKRG